MICEHCGVELQVGSWPFCTGGHGSGVSRVNSDECDYIDHNLGRDPIRITSWSQRRAIMQARGLEEMIRYVPPPEGGVKNPQGPSDWGSYRDMRPETLDWIARMMATGVPAKETPEPPLRFLPLDEGAV